MTTKTAKLLSLPFVVMALSLVGCSAADEGSQGAGADAQAAKVQVPSVEGDVAQADFCGLFRQIQCAANMGCCGRADLQSKSADECMAAAACLPPLEAPAIKSGAVVYNPQAAGDFLRELAKTASACGALPEKGELPFLEGTRQEGEDCSPVGGDQSMMAACAPGLACALSSSKEGGAKGVCARGSAEPARAADGQACEGGRQCQSGRCAEGLCAARLADGSSCQEGSECESGLCGEAGGEGECAGGACTCAPKGDRYCHLAPPEPPSNADWKTPDRLCVLAHTSSNSGTGGDLDMAWEYHGERWGCTIHGGVKTGKKACCDAGYVASTFSNSNAWLYIHSSSTDGLLIDKVYVEDGSDSWGEGTWDHVQPKGDCDGCVLGQNCNQCWLDADDHEKCKTWLFDMDDKTATCADYIGFYPLRREELAHRDGGEGPGVGGVGDGGEVTGACRRTPPSAGPPRWPRARSRRSTPCTGALALARTRAAR